MSVSGISTSLIYELIRSQAGAQEPSQNGQTQGANSNGPGGTLQQIEEEFAQLGQDLQAGNLTQAQQDFSTLSNALSAAASGAAPAATPGASGADANPVAAAFSQLQQDLQSGNLSAAQQDFTALQQAIQQEQGGGHHHHHHHGVQIGSQQASTIQQDFAALAQALQSGNLNSAQTAFSTLLQDLQNAAAGGSTAAGSSSSPGGSGGTGTGSGAGSGSGLNVTV